MKKLQLDLHNDRAMQFQINGKYIRLFVHDNGDFTISTRDPRQTVKAQNIYEDGEQKVRVLIEQYSGFIRENELGEEF